MTTPLVYGPLIKNLSTHFVELITRIAIYSPQSLSYSVDHGLKVTIDNQFEVDLSSYLSHANFSHIKLSETDSAQYLSHDHYYIYYSDSAIPSLTTAEISCIENYTGFGYFLINTFLHNHHADSERDLAECLWAEPGSDSFNAGISNILVNSAFVASGLNKIMPTPELNHTYRGDNCFTLKDVAHFKHIIETDGEYILDINAFLSTSDNKWVADSFSFHMLFHFDDDYGKDVSFLSHFPSESEFIIEPGHKIVLTGFEETDSNVIFHAKVIAPVIEKQDSYTDSELLQFQKIVDWANTNDIPTDFITPHMQLNMDMLNNTTLTSNDVFTSHVTEYSPAESPSSSPTTSAPEVADPLPLIHQDALIFL